jgi:hypothetical protein
MVLAGLKAKIVLATMDSLKMSIQTVKACRRLPVLVQSLWNCSVNSFRYMVSAMLVLGQ